MNQLPTEFGTRPKGHGVTPAKWRSWEKSYDELLAQHMPCVLGVAMPKHPIAKEIYVAGCWVQFQLKKANVPDLEVQQACCDVGTSAFIVVQEGSETQFVPQDLWKAAMELARLEGGT